MKKRLTVFRYFIVVQKILIVTVRDSGHFSIFLLLYCYFLVSIHNKVYKIFKNDQSTEY